MAWHESFGKVAGIITGACTICGVIGGAAITAVNYKTKIDSIEQIDSRLAKIETRLLGISAAVSGQEGPRGSQGLPGRQGEQGPQGERGSPGERGAKGDPSLTPAQISEIERRIGTIEGRIGSLSVSIGKTESPSPAPPRPGPSSNEMPRNASGCYYIPPDIPTVVGNFSVNDKICSLDGQTGMSITKISDERFWYDSQYGQRDCGITSSRCFPPFNNQVKMKLRRVMLDAQGQPKMEVEFSKGSSF